MHARFALSALALALVAPLSAQQPVPVAPGARVRVVSAREGVIAEGSLSRLAGDTAVLRDGLSQQAFAVGGALRLERYVGTHRNGGKGALRGAFRGALWGFVVGAAVVRCEGFLDAGSDVLNALCGGAFLVMPGSMIGAVIGGLSSTQVWEPVDGSGLRVGLSLQVKGRLGLGAALSF